MVKKSVIIERSALYIRISVVLLLLTVLSTGCVSNFETTYADYSTTRIGLDHSLKNLEAKDPLHTLHVGELLAKYFQGKDAEYTLHLIDSKLICESKFIGSPHTEYHLSMRLSDGKKNYYIAVVGSKPAEESGLLHSYEANIHDAVLKTYFNAINYIDR